MTPATPAGNISENQPSAMTPQHADPPVLVFGTGLTALGVIRGLARAGIRTYCASQQLGFIRWSRWCHPVPNQQDLVATTGDLEQYLERLPFPQAVLMPCSDEWVIATARLAGRLKERFPACQPSAATVELLIDKGDLYQMLGEYRLPHPKTVLIANEDDFKSLSADLLANSFLKPRTSQAFFRQYGVKAFRIASLDEAIARYRDVRLHGLDVVLQEYIPGPAANHFFVDGFVDRTGRLCGTFARQRIRMYPPHFGNSTYLTSIPSTKVADPVGTLARLFSTVAYRGIYSAEFKFDERDGRHKLLEVNVRPWWYIEFAESCGFPIAVMAYRDALERSVEPINTYRIGVNLVYPGYDFHACRELYRRGALTLASWAKSWLSAKPAFSRGAIRCLRWRQ